MPAVSYVEMALAVVPGEQQQHVSCCYSRAELNINSWWLSEPTTTVMQMLEQQQTQ